MSIEERIEKDIRNIVKSKMSSRRKGKLLYLIFDTEYKRQAKKIIEAFRPSLEQKQRANIKIGIN